MAGAKPVFAEVDIENLQVNINQVEKRSQEKQKQ